MAIELSMNTRIDWDSIKRFTPDLYEEYCTAPLWEIDSSDFDGPEGYHGYYTKLGQDLVITSKSIIGRWQSRGKEAAQAAERAMNPSSPVFDFQSALSEEPLPIALSQINEKVALLSANPPRPIAMPQQESQGEEVSALNQLMDMVYEDNNWPIVCSKSHYDIQFWNAACLRWTIDQFSPGVPGVEAKITLDKVAMDDIFPDPKAKELDWRYMDYCVQKHVMEIGEIQSQYPLMAHLVSASADEVISDTSVTSRNNEDYVQSPQPKMARDAAGRRQKITVLELWIKDSRMKFQPLLVEGAAGKPYKERFKLDRDGFIIGNWVKRYPDGRVLIMTGDVVLMDSANPFPHGQFPFVFPIGNPSNVWYSEGDAMRIMTVTRKFNNITSAVHRFYQSETLRPMHCDAGAIMDPNLQQQVPNDVTYLLELAPGKTLARPPATDVPPAIYTYIQLLQSMIDLTSGSSGVMRGQISDGAQLSAEALSSLQQFASSRLALSATFFNAAIRQLGYQLMWILRGIAKEKIKITITMPDGTPKVIDWESDRKVFEKGDPTEIQNLRRTEDYLMTIKAGTGKPGAQDQQQAQSLELFNNNAIDREALLDNLQYPNRQAIAPRMRAKELEDLTTAAEGRAIGLSVATAIKETSPGRKKKS